MSELEEYIKSGRKLAWLAYLGLLMIIPAIAQKDNPYTVFHIKQGLVLLFASIIDTLFVFIPSIGADIATVGSFFLLILNIIGIYNALAGKLKPLPVIGGFANLFDF